MHVFRSSRLSFARVFQSESGVFDPQIQRDSAAILQPYFTSTGLVIKALEHASKMEHIMDFTRLRSLSSLFSMLHQACRNVALYNNNHPDFPMPIDQLEKYMQVCKRESVHTQRRL